MKNQELRIGTSRVQFFLPMIFTLVIGLITAANMFYWEGVTAQIQLWKVLSLFSGFILLMLLDMTELLVFPRPMPMVIKPLLFICRLLLICGMQWLEASDASLPLLALIPYYSFFIYGGLISIIFSSLLLGYFYYLMGEIGEGITAGVANLVFLQIISFFMGHTQNVTLKNRELLQELQRTNTEMQYLAQEMAELSAVEERMRLSRDLHDSIGHHLTAISIQLEKAIAYQHISTADSFEAVENARRSASEALAEVRGFINTLKDQPDLFSISDKIKPILDGLQKAGLAIEYEISGEENLYSGQKRRQMFYSLQELLTNIQKHANASQVKIKVNFGRKEATLLVEDNGEGFDVWKETKKEGHYGLENLQHRAQTIDGKVIIKSKKGKGAHTEIRVPRKVGKVE